MITAHVSFSSAHVSFSSASVSFSSASVTISYFQLILFFLVYKFIAFLNKKMSFGKTRELKCRFLTEVTTERNLAFERPDFLDPFTAIGHFHKQPPRWPTFLAMLFQILKEGMGPSLFDKLEVRYHVIKM